MKSATLWRRIHFLAAALAIVVAGHGAPPKAQSPADEIAVLDKLLSDAGRSLDISESLETFLYTTSALASRMDVFELRFGVQPQTLPQWRGLSARAAKLLQRVDGRHDRDIYFNADSAEAGTCVLLELAGRQSAALRRLDRVQPGGGCGNWMASVMLAVNQQKAGIHQRAGDYRKAFALMKDARAAMDLALQAPEPDLFHCRYAFLAAKNGQAAEARASYQKVVDLYPHSTGDEIARKALTRSGDLIEPDLSRLNRLYIEDPKSREYDAAIHAIGAHKFAGSFDDLKGKLIAAEAWRRNRIIPALGKTGDPRALPILRQIVEDGADWANALHALAALGRLGDRGPVIPYLRRLRTSDEKKVFVDGSWMDAVLRDIYGDGPEPMKLEAAFNTPPAELAQRWLNWIEQRQKAQAGAGKV